MTFSADLHAFAEKAAQRTTEVFVATTVEVQKSVVEGSAVTGAVGQPVDTGYLKNSWIGAFTSKTEWELTTNVSYAPVIEDNLRESFDDRGVDRPKGFTGTREPGAPRKGPSTVGGNHSVKTTIAGFQRIVDFANKEIP